MRVLAQFLFLCLVLFSNSNPPAFPMFHQSLKSIPSKSQRAPVSAVRSAMQGDHSLHSGRKQGFTQWPGNQEGHEWWWEGGAGTLQGQEARVP